MDCISFKIHIYLISWVSCCALGESSLTSYSILKFCTLCFCYCIFLKRTPTFSPRGLLLSQPFYDSFYVSTIYLLFLDDSLHKILFSHLLIRASISWSISSFDCSFFGSFFCLLILPFARSFVCSFFIHSFHLKKNTDMHIHYII